MASQLRVDVSKELVNGSSKIDRLIDLVGKKVRLESNNLRRAPGRVVVGGIVDAAVLDVFSTVVEVYKISIAGELYEVFDDDNLYIQ